QRNWSMRSRFAPLAFIAACLAMTTAERAPAKDRQKIKVTGPTPSIMFYPLYYGQEKGYFPKENIDVEVIVTNGDGPDVDAVISGRVQFAVSTPNRLFRDM